MQALLDACEAGKIAITPDVLISNNRNAESTGAARSNGMPANLLNSVTHPEPDVLDKTILATLQRHECELIVLAGYMKKIGPHVLEAFRNRSLRDRIPLVMPK